MSVPLIINGTTYNYPQQGDVNWGPTLTNWSTAVTSGMLQTSGVNKPVFIASATLNPSSTGFLRLAKTDTLSWRNNLNNADLPLGINASNQLTFNGSPIGATTALTNTHIFVGNVSNQPADVAMSGDTTITNTGVVTIANDAITNVKVAAAAAIAVTKLAALTASRGVVTDGSGFLVSATTTATEIGYVNGVTSSIQTQLNTLTSNQANYLPLAGGTMSGAISMESNKITALSAGTSNGEALSYGQGFDVGNHKITGVSVGTSSTDAVNFSQIKLIQVLSATNVTPFLSTSSTYSATNLQINITPTSASNRIFIWASGTLRSSAVNNSPAFATIFRDTTNLAAAAVEQEMAKVLISNGGNTDMPATMTIVDSPATTSTITYSIQIRNSDNTTQVAWGNTSLTSIVVAEIV